jgi:copper transport protein
MIARLLRLALALTGALFVVLPAGLTPAGAHASLLRAEPQDGAMLATAPAEFRLIFNEPVAPLVFKLVGPDGAAIELTGEAQNETIKLRPPSPLQSGTSLLSWRVVSADGHPVGGALLFSVGHRSETTTLAGETGDGVVRATIWLTRILIYLGLFFGIGGAFFVTWAAPSVPPSAKRAIFWSITAGLIAVPLSVGLQGLDALAVPLTAIGQGASWLAGWRTTYADTAIAAVVALMLASIALSIEKAQRVLSLFAVIGVGMALASSGHASAASPEILMRPAVFVHAAAVALWAGSLIPLFALLRKPDGGSAALMRFSRAAPLVIAFLFAAGVALAIVQIARPEALWTTGYGRIFLLKCGVLAALAVLAAANRFVFTPAVLLRNASATRRLRYSIAAEIGLAVIIFGLVAGWRFTPPPRALLSREPAFVHLHSDGAMADATLEPGRAGPVHLRVRLMRDDFSPLTPREVSIRLSNQAAGIEAIARSAALDGEGYWRANDIVLPVPGVWTLEIDALVTDFEKVRLDGPLVVEP